MSFLLSLSGNTFSCAITNFPMVYQRSVRLYQIGVILRAFWLGQFISILFLKYVGLGDIDISIFHAITGVLVFCLEIPTGIFADRYGYKTSIILSHLSLMAFFLIAVMSTFTTGLLVLLIGPIVRSAYETFGSGAAQSYVYMAFKLDGREKDYLPFNSRLGFYSGISKAIATLTGVYLYTINPIFPYSIQAFLMIIAVILFCLMKPIPRSNIDTIHSLRSHAKKAFHIFQKQHFLIVLFTFLFLSTVVYQFFNHLINQSYWLEKGISVSLIGWIGIGVFTIQGVVSLSAPYLWRWFGEKYVYIVLSIVAILIPVGLGVTDNIFLISLLSGLIYALYSVSDKIVDYSVQKNIGDGLRASVLSIGNMFVGMGFKVSMLLAGIVVGYVSYSLGLLILGIVFGVAALIVGWWCGVYNIRTAEKIAGDNSNH